MYAFIVKCNCRLMLFCMMVLLMLEEVGIRMPLIRLFWNLSVIDRTLWFFIPFVWLLNSWLKVVFL